MKKLIIALSLCFYSHLNAQMIVNDPSMQMQQLFNFMSEMEQVVKQETMMAEELMMKYEEFEKSTKKEIAEKNAVIKRIEKGIILYREIEGCYKALDNLRKNLLFSNYLTLNEKYTIYSRAQIICYDIITRISDIDEMVDSIKSYSYSPTEESSKEPKLDKTIAIVRQIRARIRDMEIMSINLINHKRSIVNTDLYLRRSFNLQLY